MGNRLRSIWQGLNASYWFYPALFAIGALVLALVTVELDRAGWAERVADLVWLHPAQPGGASNMLTVIAGSMIGVASTVFSITIAAVVYASGTYGPRLLTNFMENRGNQLSLATFIGTFVYALSVLRTVRSAGEGVDGLAGAFVPQLSLQVAYALMALSIAVLVYFLNHIPASIRINSVLQEIGERLIEDIGERFPQPVGSVPRTGGDGGEALDAESTGYVQQIDFARLEGIAAAADATIRLAVRAGDFVHPNVPLLYWCGKRTADRKTLRFCANPFFSVENGPRHRTCISWSMSWSRSACARSRRGSTTRSPQSPRCTGLARQRRSWPDAISMRTASQIRMATCATSACWATILRITSSAGSGRCDQPWRQALRRPWSHSKAWPMPRALVQPGGAIRSRQRASG